MTFSSTTPDTDLVTPTAGPTPSGETEVDQQRQGNDDGGDGAGSTTAPAAADGGAVGRLEMRMGLLVAGVGACIAVLGF